METLYKVKDKFFSDIEDAKAFEKELKEMELHKKKLVAEKQERINEITTKKSELNDLIKKFSKDYGSVDLKFNNIFDTDIIDDYFSEILKLFYHKGDNK